MFTIWKILNVDRYSLHFIIFFSEIQFSYGMHMLTPPNKSICNYQKNIIKNRMYISIIYVCSKCFTKSWYFCGQCKKDKTSSRLVSGPGAVWKLERRLQNSSAFVWLPLVAWVAEASTRFVHDLRIDVDSGAAAAPGFRRSATCVSFVVVLLGVGFCSTVLGPVLQMLGCRSGRFESAYLALGCLLSRLGGRVVGSSGARSRDRRVVLCCLIFS
jgi:hypothetical protein